MVEQTFSTIVDYINRYSATPWELELLDNTGHCFASSKFETKTEAKSTEQYWKEQVALDRFPDNYGNWS